MNDTHLYEKLKRLWCENARLKEECELLKKGDDLLRQGISLRYAFIEAHERAFDTALMCRVVEASHSGYYE